MRTLFTIMLLLLFSITLYSQKDVTKFLGIPVDGSKSEMIQKLKEKGFVSSTYNKEILIGEFNGSKVNLHIVTNNNKVCRIMVSDDILTDEVNIKIRFNNLCRQFDKNPKYKPLFENYILSKSENISYGILIEKKQYTAGYFQYPENIDSLATNVIRPALLTKYTEEEIENSLNAYKLHKISEISNPEEIQDKLIVDYISCIKDIFSKKKVWFMISYFSDKYCINLFYDNEYNMANGEDL